ncbi:MAG: alpha/beta hydrolase [Gemmatimonadaceae bacterium]|nr:alpha/beta hydrolase [Gemmatimonadaceae bacterium]
MRALLLVFTVMIMACQSGDVTPTTSAAPATIERTRVDVRYASQSNAQRLDLFLPATGSGPFPLVVWIHGGGFSGGTKTLAADAAARRLVDRGFAVASLEYRLSGEARFPAAVLDLKAAIRHLRANASNYRIAPDRIGAWGSSAGGHLAAFLGVTGGIVEFEDAALGNATQSSRVQAVVDWFGPSDLAKMDVDGTAQGCALYAGIGHDNANSPEGRWLGDKPSSIPQVASRASPVTWVSDDDPPFVIQHGGRDCTVPTGQGRRMRDALLPVLGASRVSWSEFPTDGHGGPSFGNSANLDALATFFERWIR